MVTQVDERVHFLKKNLSDAQSLEEVQDVAELLALYMDDAMQQESRLLSNGLRRPTKRGLYGAAKRAGADLLVEKLGLTVEQLADNVQARSQSTSGPHVVIRVPHVTGVPFVQPLSSAHRWSPEYHTMAHVQALSQHLSPSAHCAGIN